MSIFREHVPVCWTSSPTRTQKLIKTLKRRFTAVTTNKISTRVLGMYVLLACTSPTQVRECVGRICSAVTDMGMPKLKFNKDTTLDEAMDHLDPYLHASNIRARADATREKAKENERLHREFGVGDESERCSNCKRYSLRTVIGRPCRMGAAKSQAGKLLCAFGCTPKRK
jgi:hypothetical protein